MNKSPKKYVSLHNHSGASSFDGMGPPAEHFKFCLENGLDAHAITDHGHMNAFASAFLFMDKWKKEGVNFKYIPGCELYVHPDLEGWRRDKDNFDLRKADAKRLAKEEKEKNITLITRKTNEDDETESVEMSNALTIENEDETKNLRRFNPINRRHHLVILPKTPRALKQIFHLVSQGYLEGFYRFPRVDLKQLKRAAQACDNELIISSACLGGILSYEVMSTLQQYKFDDLNASLLDDPQRMNAVLKAIGNTFDTYADAMGRDNVMLEIQFNKLSAQDIVNRAIIEYASQNGLTGQLIATSDAHYPRPELWRHREMYKKLGYLNYSDLNADSIPKSSDELKAELYPKNADQMWDEFLRAKSKNEFYDQCQDLVCDAIERTHDIAHQVIQDITFDRSFKFPQKRVSPGKTAFQTLVEEAKNGLVARGLADKPEYVDRLKHELSVIKQMNFAEYFVTLARIIYLARDVTLLGVARGSGGGSLTAYCLNITDLDPIKYDCRFDRFLNVFREGAPDIDIDVGDRDKVLEQLYAEFGKNNVLPISNVNTFKVKTLVKDISKFYGIPFEEVNAATKTVEQDVRKAVTKHGDDKNLFVLQFDEAMKYSPSFSEYINKHPEIAESINVLFKEQRSLGRHAGGVVVLDDAPQIMPLIQSGGEAQTPWVEGVEVKTLEPLGYIKYDLLGLETMRLIERAIALIIQREDPEKKYPTFMQIRDWYRKNLHPDVNDYDDQRVYKKVYHDGNFAGIFQLTSQGAQRLFKAAKPTSIVDIAVLTSIYRPGPLAAKVDKLYVEARKGKKYDWGHPLFEQVLSKTDNLLIFQEQVMDLAEHVGGFPKDQCDKVRKAIMKRSISGGEEAKKKAREMEDKFVQGAVEKGVPESTAREAYQKILWFAGYGFNKTCHFLECINIYDKNHSLKETKFIKDVLPGDIVKSRDEKTGEDVYVPVVEKHDHGILDLVEVELTTGEKVKCTWDHKFRVKETGEMLPLWLINQRKLSIVVSSVDFPSKESNG